MQILAGAESLTNALVRYGKLCYDRGLVGAAGGNVSARLPGRDLFVVSASGVALRDLSVETLVVVDGAGKTVEGAPGLRPSKETGFHLSIFRARPAAQAVVHVHPPYAVLFSALGQQIPLVTVSAKLKLKQGPVVAEADPGSQALNDGVSRALDQSGKDASVLLLRNHGLVSFAGTLGDAFDFAELASDTAKIAWLLQTRATEGAGRAEAVGGAGARLEAGVVEARAAGARGSSIVDLTASLDGSLPCYPTDPRYERTVHVDFSDAGMYLSKITMGLHAGTHVDAPLHFLPNGRDVLSMPPESFFGPAVAINAPKTPGQDIVSADFAGADIRRGDIVLFRTGWQAHMGTDRFFQGEWPGFSVEAVWDLAARGVKAIGGDIASADSPRHIAGGAPAHKAALGAGLPIFEALVNLDRVVGARFWFLGLPLRIAGGEASPIRAIAILET